jgi:hypothetical protein
VALLLVHLQLRSGIAFRLAAPLAAAMLAYVALAGGRLLLAAAGVRDEGLPAAFALGLLAACAATYALAATLGVTAAAAATAVAALVAGADLGLRRGRFAGPWAPPAMTGFALCLGLVAAWCTFAAGAYDTARTQHVLPVWVDYFFHGGLVSQLGDPLAAGRGSIFLADHPPSFYHFASYAAAAALAWPLDAPGLALATSVWLPLGLLAMLCAAHALGERLAGRAGGLAAVAAIAILPDASNYGLRNGLFSFHWTLFASPGAAYALGAAFLSLALLDRWAGERSRAALAASALLAAATLLFRAHVFVLFAPAWLATAILCTARLERRSALAAIALMAAMAAIAATAAASLADLSAAGAQWRFGEQAFEKFLAEVHTRQEPTAYGGLYEALAGGEASGFALAAGALLAFVAALGAFAIALPAAAVLARRAGALRPIDAFPAFLAHAWLLLMLFAPVPWHGDATDLIHRPFVLLYAAAAVWTTSLLLRAYAARRGAAAGRLGPALAAVTLVSLPVIAASAERMAGPKFEWGRVYVSQPLEAGLGEAAGYLRRNARAGDTFATAGLDAGYTVLDLPMKICALTGLPAYLSRPYLEMAKDERRRSEAAARLQALQGVERAADHGEAMEALRRLRVRWYLVAGAAGPAWDRGRARAAFRAGSIALYSAHAEASRGALQDGVRVRNADQVAAHRAAHLAELAPGERLVGRGLAHVPATVQ